MLQLRPLDIATGYHDPPLENVLENLKAMGSARFETGHRRKDGTVVPVEVHDHLLSRDGRKIVIGVVRDITENKQNLNAVKIANKKLNLLANITRHDINNQLMVLQGYLTLLETRHPEIVKDGLLHKAEHSTERISAMIQFTKPYEDIGVQSPIWQDVHKLREKCAKEVNLGMIKLENEIPLAPRCSQTRLWSRSFVILYRTRRYMAGMPITSISLSRKNQGNARSFAWMMVSVYRQTGKISCSRKDSVRAMASVFSSHGRSSPSPA